MYEYKTSRLDSIPLICMILTFVVLNYELRKPEFYLSLPTKDRFIKAYSSIDGTLVPQSNRFSDAVFASEQTYAEGAKGLVS